MKEGGALRARREYFDNDEPRAESSGNVVYPREWEVVETVRPSEEDQARARELSEKLKMKMIRQKTGEAPKTSANENLSPEEIKQVTEAMSIAHEAPKSSESSASIEHPPAPAAAAAGASSPMPPAGGDHGHDGHHEGGHHGHKPIGFLAGTLGFLGILAATIASYVNKWFDSLGKMLVKETGLQLDDGGGGKSSGSGHGGGHGGGHH